jgi:iron complex outermembrane recepter protein
MTRSRQRKIQRVREAGGGEAQSRTGKALRNVPLASAITAILAGTPVVFAQDQSEATGVLEEVIVTAQKRTESMQDVPVAIDAIGNAKLEQLHIQGVDDFVKFLPNVSYQTFGPGFAKVYMRGVSSGGDGIHSGSLPSVGVYLDEQPVTTIQGPIDVHLYDIARVESLAGPQGTLYGASSQAGTIRIITNKPDPKGFTAGYELQENTVKNGKLGYVLEGFANIPLSDKAAIRLVGWKEYDSGYIDNKAFALTYPNSGFVNDNTQPPTVSARSQYNNSNIWGARAALKVNLNENWSITPAVMGQRSSASGIFAFDPRAGDLAVNHFYPEGQHDQFDQASLTVEGKLSNFDVVYAGAYLQRKDESSLDYTDYSLGYEIYYNQARGYFYDDAGAAINPTQQIRGNDHYKMYSNELRVSSPKEYRFRATVGVFAARQTHDILQNYVIDGLSTAESVAGWTNTWWLTNQVRINRDSAVFADLSYDIVPNLTASAGIRFFKAENSLYGFYGFGSRVTDPRYCLNPLYQGLAPVNGGPCVDLNAIVKETGNTPKVNLAWKIDDQHLVYATYAKGFRPGGVNRVGTLPPYKADFLTSYELGWKTSWFGNHLRFNGAFFLEDWNDFQFSFLSTNSVTQIANAGTARITGVEAQIDWSLSSGLMLSGGFALMDPKLRDNFCKYLSPTGGAQTSVCLDGDGNSVPFDAPSGQQLPTTPKFKGNVVARYAFSLGDLDAHAQGSVVYQSAVWADLRTEARDIIGLQPEFTLVDLSFGLAKGAYSAELYINNVFDQRAEAFRYTQCTEAVCGGIVGAVYRGVFLPRSIGVKFGQKF